MKMEKKEKMCGTLLNKRDSIYEAICSDIHLSAKEIAFGKQVCFAVYTCRCCFFDLGKISLEKKNVQLNI